MSDKNGQINISGYLYDIPMSRFCSAHHVSFHQEWKSIKWYMHRIILFSKHTLYRMQCNQDVRVCLCMSEQNDYIIWVKAFLFKY